ncbi:tRNA epoxyqueuosine(34) reductase QueG [Planctomycetes bacterium K23_9]|uniref:Epoxyqueuosine reductase n=1 Tax=Stieleria marina TaxID=1930275 RepID=A0A517NVF1_9BACT|nr:Epoxyqueuosine reductase [Planctomycetes bacterium K23_9]
MATTNLLDDISAMAAAEGFILSGVAPAVDSAGFTELVRWIDDGYCADMDYFANRLDAYQNPSGVLPGAKSVVALAYPYPATSPSAIPVNYGRVARYTWIGQDYHDVIHPKLKRICRLVRRHQPESNARGIVDTAPLMEREFAQLAGLGWRGKNTLLLNKQFGSYFFLACVLVDIELPTSDPQQNSHCGTCTACLDACPTDAFPSAGVLDASRCISYLTIENKDSIPALLRPGIGDWAFGCDICQEVCPWNTRPARSATQTDAPDSIDLLDLFWMDEAIFRERFRKSPMWRTRRRGMLRNAAIVLGNTGDALALDALRQGSRDQEPIVQEACRWAIENIQSRSKA